MSDGLTNTIKICYTVILYFSINSLRVTLPAIYKLLLHYSVANVSTWLKSLLCWLTYEVFEEMWLSSFDVVDDLKDVDFLLSGDHVTRIRQRNECVT